MMEGRVSRGSATPPPKGWGHGAPRFSGSATYDHMDDTATKFCMVIKLDERKIFTWLISLWLWPKYFL